MNKKTIKVAGIPRVTSLPKPIPESIVMEKINIPKEAITEYSILNKYCGVFLAKIYKAPPIIKLISKVSPAMKLKFDHNNLSPLNPLILKNQNTISMIIDEIIIVCIWLVSIDILFGMVGG